MTVTDDKGLRVIKVSLTNLPLTRLRLDDNVR